MTRSPQGFSLVETLVAASIVLALTGAMVEMARSARAGCKALGDMADAQQKMRVAADAIEHDLMRAGAGTREGARAGPLTRFLPPIRGSGAPTDGDLTFATDRITLLWVPDAAAEAAVTGPAGDASGIPVGGSTPCVVSPTCGFTEGMQAVILDGSGPGFGYDVFTVGATVPGAIWPASGSFSRVYDTSGQVSEVVRRTYYLDRSDTTNVRLMRGDGRSAFPLLDDIRNLRFVYYADPDPASVSTAGSESGTCVYAAGPPPRPLLAALGGHALAQLAPAELTDGPFCGSAPNRFDADLLRIRRVRVHLAIGAGSRDQSWELAFDVSPRNVNLSR
jgi:hypothetical protein